MGYFSQLDLENREIKDSDRKEYLHVKLAELETRKEELNQQGTSKDLILKGGPFRHSVDDIKYVLPEDIRDYVTVDAAIDLVKWELWMTYNEMPKEELTEESLKLESADSIDFKGQLSVFDYLKAA